MNYLLNTWYAAGFSAEFSQAPQHRRLLEKDIVIFRTVSGKLSALKNQCPHRFAPLHLGKVIGDCIQCPYHGLRFGSDGKCSHNPIGEGKIPKAAVIDAYAMEERDGIAWIWFGEEPADPEKITRFREFSEEGGFETVQDYIFLQAEYQLLVDNLLDLSHAEFLHPNLSCEGFASRTQYSMEQEGNLVVARNFRPNEPISRIWETSFKSNPPSHVDSRSIVTWYPPSVLHLEIGVTHVGRPNSEGTTSVAAHLITPADANTCHYFWIFGRDFRLGEPEYAAKLQEAVQTVFANEDEPMIEAQFANLNGHDFESLKPVLLPTDSASMRARRVLKQLIAEQASS